MKWTFPLKKNTLEDFPSFQTHHCYLSSHVKPKHGLFLVQKTMDMTRKEKHTWRLSEFPKHINGAFSHKLNQNPKFCLAKFFKTKTIFEKQKQNLVFSFPFFGTHVKNNFVDLFAIKSKNLWSILYIFNYSLKHFTKNNQKYLEFVYKQYVFIINSQKNCFMS